MVKLWIELRGPDGQEREAFLDRLAEELAPSVAADAATLGLRRAVLDRRIAAAEIDAFCEDRGWAPAGDAMLELWFDDVAALEAALGSSEGREALGRLAGPAASSATVTRPHEVFDRFEGADGGGRIKLVVQNQGRPDLTLEQFMEHWVERHAPLVTEVGPALGYRRYVQDHPVASPALEAYADERGWRSPPEGGVTEVWWDGREEQLAAFAGEEGAKASAVMAEDEPRFVHPPAMTAFLATEQVLLG